MNTNSNVRYNIFRCYNENMVGRGGKEEGMGDQGYFRQEIFLLKDGTSQLPQPLATTP